MQENRQSRKPSIYNPIKDYEKLVLTAINIGTTAMNKASELTVKEAIMSFVSEYGMLGLMTALPTTPDFITYETVYLPKNHFIKEESMTTEKYLSYFFPFDKIDFVKKEMFDVSVKQYIEQLLDENARLKTDLHDSLELNKKLMALIQR